MLAPCRLSFGDLSMAISNSIKNIHTLFLKPTRAISPFFSRTYKTTKYVETDVFQEKEQTKKRTSKMCGSSTPSSSPLKSPLQTEWEKRMDADITRAAGHPKMAASARCLRVCSSLPGKRYYLWMPELFVRSKITRRVVQNERNTGACDRHPFILLRNICLKNLTQ